MISDAIIMGVPDATCKVVVGRAKACVAFIAPNAICATALPNARYILSQAKEKCIPCVEFA